MHVVTPVSQYIITRHSADMIKLVDNGGNVSGFFALEPNGTDVAEFLVGDDGGPMDDDSSSLIDPRGNDDWDLCLVLTAVLQGKIDLDVTDVVTVVKSLPVFMGQSSASKAEVLTLGSHEGTV
jgi:hypothetical protein